MSAVDFTATLEIGSIRLAAGRLRCMVDLGLADKVSILLNRVHHLSEGIADDEGGKLIGMPITLSFSNDYSTVQDVIIRGGPISHRSDLSGHIMQLARSVTPHQSSCR